MFQLFATSSAKTPVTDSSVPNTQTNLVSCIDQCNDGLKNGIAGNNKIANKKIHEDAINNFKNAIEKAINSGNREEKGHALITLVKASKIHYLPDTTKMELAGFIQMLNTNKAFTNLTLSSSHCKALVQEMNSHPDAYDSIGWANLDLSGLQVQVTTKFLVDTLADASKYDWETSAEEVKNASDLLKLLSTHHLFDGLDLSKIDLSKIKQTALDLAGFKSNTTNSKSVIEQVRITKPEITKPEISEDEECSGCVVS